MSIKNAVIFQVLLNYFHPQANAKLFKCLPSKEAEEILGQTTSLADPMAVIEWPKKLIARTHYSWFLPMLKEQPVYRQMAILEALPESHSSKLRDLLHIPPFEGSLIPSMKESILTNFYRSWNPDETFPLTSMPKSTLSPLLELSKNELVELISCFALYDVASTLRTIVDKTLLKKIYHSLSSKQQELLRVCAHYKGKINIPKLDLSSWDGRPESFGKILQNVGMMRLGKALCGQPRSLLWLLTRTLDVGRGKIIENYYKETEIPGISLLLEQQALFILNHLKPKGVA